MKDSNFEHLPRLRRLAMFGWALAALLAGTTASASTLQPVISGWPSASVGAGRYYTFTPKASGPTGYRLTFSISGKPAWAHFNSLSGQLSGTPSTANIGRYANIVIRVSDAVKSASLPPFSITVESPASAALAISGWPSPGAGAGHYYSFTPKARGPTGYPLSFSISGKPAWAHFNSLSGQLSGTPSTANIGRYANIVIRVSDAVKSASLPPFSITVESPGSAAPTISGWPSPGVGAGHYYSFSPKARGPTGYPLTFSISGKPAWAHFNSLSGQLSGTPSTANIGRYANIVIRVSDAVKSASLSPFSITVASPASAAPTISGTPPTTATVGTPYTFTPKASDTDGDALSFSVQNKPAWATFSIAKGTISGTPAASSAGTYSSIIVSVSDGHSSAALAPFSITVVQAPVSGSTGSATLTWTAPTTNTNGSGLTDLAGYHIYYGNSPSAMTRVITLANPATTSYTVSSLASGTWYFAMNAYTTSGLDSARSNTGSKSIP